MKIILSPAKKMKTDDAMAPCGMPVFLDRTQEILRVLQARSPQELQSLWKCNARIAEQNVQRLQGMDLRSAYTPAVFAYDGMCVYTPLVLTVTLALSPKSRTGEKRHTNQRYSIFLAMKFQTRTRIVAMTLDSIK